MFTKEELNILEQLLNEDVEELLNSGYNLNNEYVVLIRNIISKLGLRETWDYDKKYGGKVED